METVSLDAFVIDSLMPDLVGHDRQPSAFLVFLHLWRKTLGGRRTACASYQMIANGTGLSKRAVQLAVATLARRELLDVQRKSATAAPVFSLLCHWRSRS